MSRKSKIDAVKKIKIVEQYLNGELSQKGAAKICDVNKRHILLNILMILHLRLLFDFKYVILITI